MKKKANENLPKYGKSDERTELGCRICSLLTYTQWASVDDQATKLTSCCKSFQGADGEAIETLLKAIGDNLLIDLWGIGSARAIFDLLLHIEPRRRDPGFVNTATKDFLLSKGCLLGNDI